MTLSHLPRPVTGPFVAARNGIVYVAGGLAGANDIVASLQESTRIVLQPAVQLAGAKDDVITFLQAYEVATDRWTQLAPMPEPRFDGCGAQWVGGLLVVMGGWTYIPEALPHNDAFVYDPAGGVWRR